jgi:hypothetical protein
MSSPRTFVVPVRARVAGEGAEVVVLGDLMDCCRDVRSLQRDPRADCTVHTVAEGADLDGEVVGQILAAQLFDGRLQGSRVRSL